MNRLSLITLVVATLAFDLFVIWAVGFTVVWNGSVPPASALGFWIIAASPLVVTAYCIRKWRTYRRR